MVQGGRGGVEDEPSQGVTLWGQSLPITGSSYASGRELSVGHSNPN